MIEQRNNLLDSIRELQNGIFHLNWNSETISLARGSIQLYRKKLEKLAPCSSEKEV